jgi:hypothetical protein
MSSTITLAYGSEDFHAKKLYYRMKTTSIWCSNHSPPSPPSTSLVCLRCEVSERATHRSSPHGPCEPSARVTGRAQTYATYLPKQDSTLPEAASEQDQHSPHYPHRLPRHSISLLYHHHLDTTVTTWDSRRLPVPHRLCSSLLGVHQRDMTAPLPSTSPFADALSHRTDLPRA